MKNFDDYIKRCNLIFTGVCDDMDFTRCDFDIDNVNPILDNSISLLQFASLFNRLYLNFKNDYDKLEKLDLGELVQPIMFRKFNFDNDNYRYLSLYLLNPNMTNHYNTFLYIREINGEIKSFVTNEHKHADKDFYQEDVTINNELEKKYLDLFDKHSLFFDLYNYIIENPIIYGSGSYYILSLINEPHIDGCFYDKENNLLYGLDTLKISACGYSEEVNDHLYVNLKFNLKNDFNIDYDNSSITIDTKNTNEKDHNVYDNFANKIYINKDKIKVRKR